MYSPLHSIDCLFCESQSEIDDCRVPVLANVSLSRLSAKGAIHIPERSASSLTHTLCSLYDAYSVSTSLIFLFITKRDR